MLGIRTRGCRMILGADKTTELGRPAARENSVTQVNIFNCGPFNPKNKVRKKLKSFIRNNFFAFCVNITGDDDAQGDVVSEHNKNKIVEGNSVICTTRS